MKVTKENNKIHEQLFGLFDVIYNRVNNLLSATLENERRFEAASSVLLDEVFRHFETLVESLLKLQTEDSGDIEKHVTKLLVDAVSNAQGLIFTVIESVVPTEHRSPTIDIASRVIWRDYAITRESLISILSE